MASFAGDLAAALVANQALITRVTELMETRRRMGKSISPETADAVAQWHDQMVQLNRVLARRRMEP